MMPMCINPFATLLGFSFKKLALTLTQCLDVCEEIKHEIRSHCQTPDTEP